MDVQSILTGESDSVTKSPEANAAQKAVYQDKTCLLFSVGPHSVSAQQAYEERYARQAAACIMVMTHRLEVKVWPGNMQTPAQSWHTL